MIKPIPVKKQKICNINKLSAFCFISSKDINTSKAMTGMNGIKVMIFFLILLIFVFYSF
jgi:hypothetical protein